jgi:phage tail-like protein
MPIQKIMPLAPRKKYAWALEMKGFIFAHFQKCTMPEVEVEIAEFNSAGTLHARKTASRLKYNTIECEKMMVEEGADKAAYEWLRRVADANTGLGLLPDMYMMDVDLIHFNRMGVPIDRWTLHGAFLCKLDYDDLEGGNKDDLMEKIGIAYQYYTRQ